MDPNVEVVDIVDEVENVIGNASKNDAHKKGLLHRTVIAEVIDKTGRMLLVKQSSSRQDAGQFVSPVGGHVSSGETNDEALKREAMEELGISDFTFKLVGKAIFSRDVLGRHENHFYIVYEIYSDAEPVLNHESESFVRFSKTHLKKRIHEAPEEFGAAWHFVVKNFYPELLRVPAVKNR